MDIKLHFGVLFCTKKRAQYAHILQLPHIQHRALHQGMRHDIPRWIDIFIKLERVIISLHLHDSAIIETIEIRIDMPSKKAQGRSVTHNQDRVVIFGLIDNLRDCVLHALFHMLIRLHRAIHPAITSTPRKHIFIFPLVIIVVLFLQVLHARVIHLMISNNFQSIAGALLRRTKGSIKFNVLLFKVAINRLGLLDS